MGSTPVLHMARDLDDAISSLRRYEGEAHLMAGSTALTIMLRQGLIDPPALIGLGNVEGLDGIGASESEIVIGSLTTHREVERSRLVGHRLPVLAQTFGKVANVRVRNAATVGGVLAEGDYASDPPPLLVGLDAVVDVRGPAGSRSIAAADLFRGFYETALEPFDVITRVRIPIPATPEAMTYEKYVSRSNEDRPCVGVFASAAAGPDGVISHLRVVVGAVAGTPQSFPEVGSLAEGQRLDHKVTAAVADAYAERISPIEDLRGTASYRRQMIRVWIGRALSGVAGELPGPKDRPDGA